MIRVIPDRFGRFLVDPSIFRPHWVCSHSIHVIAVYMCSHNTHVFTRYADQLKKPLFQSKSKKWPKSAAGLKVDQVSARNDRNDLFSLAGFT